jgi:hypothetical protein
MPDNQPQTHRVRLTQKEIEDLLELARNTDRYRGAERGMTVLVGKLEEALEYFPHSRRERPIGDDDEA